jgi:hypothetical protein
MSELQAYLSMMEQMISSRGDSPPFGRTHHTLAGWVHEHGESHESQPLTDDEITWLFRLLDAEGGRYRIKECYYNAQRVLLFANAWGFDEHELSYAEGYAQSIIPVPHGWLLLNGKVVDLTMRLREPLSRTSRVHRRRLRNRAFGEFPETREYFGTVFPTESVLNFMRRTGTLGSLIDDWPSDFPILDPHSPDNPLPMGAEA